MHLYTITSQDTVKLAYRHHIITRMIEASLKINPSIRRLSLLYTAEVLMHAWSTHVQHLHKVERKASFRMETHADAVFLSTTYQR